MVGTKLARARTHAAGLGACHRPSPCDTREQKRPPLRSVVYVLGQREPNRLKSTGFYGKIAVIWSTKCSRGDRSTQVLCRRANKSNTWAQRNDGHTILPVGSSHASKQRKFTCYHMEYGTFNQHGFLCIKSMKKETKRKERIFGLAAGQGACITRSPPGARVPKSQDFAANAWR